MADQRPALASLLITKTANDGMKWQHGSDDESIVAVLGKGRVAVSREEYRDNYVISIRVYDSSGELIETFNDEDLETLSANRSWYPLLYSMLKSGIRNASGADTKLAEIIDELNGDIPF